MSRTKVWMFWWNTCLMHKVMPREYLQCVQTLLLLLCQDDVIIVHDHDFE